MRMPTLTPRALAANANQPPARRGPAYQTVAMSSCFLVIPEGLSDTIEVPRFIESTTFLMYAGFTEGIAIDIYERWTRPRDRTRTFFQFVVDCVLDRAEEKDAIGPQGDFAGAFQHLGMTQSYCSGALKCSPEVVATYASVWVIETTWLIYASLCSLSPIIELEQDRVDRARTAFVRAYSAAA